VRILGLKEGHDGSIALIEDGRLIFCIEAEKDSYPRCWNLTAELVARAGRLVPGIPDVVAIGGWVKGIYSSERGSLAGYFGCDQADNIIEDASFFGAPVKMFSSTHERSHIWNAYAMSPLPQGEPCYVLVWEGNIGNFYFVDEELRIEDYGPVMVDPGNKYSFLYHLADTDSPSQPGLLDIGHPGKLMALAAFGERGRMSADERAVTDFILSRQPIRTTAQKDDLRWSPFHNIGVESQAFKDLAAKFSDHIFQLFLDYARRNLEAGKPLLIVGGCALNCDWNARWRDSGMFSEVFVPPCCNDSGSAIGTAVDAMQQLSGQAKLEWSVYAGEEFVWDCDPTSAGFTSAPLEPASLASRLSDGAIIAWVEGRYEIGPRALGHRSLIAEPFRPQTRDRLNAIKQREGFRPIAPMCLEDQAGDYFAPSNPSPHMLFVHRVLDRRLAAIMHVDGSARIQTVAPDVSSSLTAVLNEFRVLTGVSVLCNTSLNLQGRGLINRMSDLVEYTLARGVDEIIVDGRRFTPSATAGRG
jgi:predicted NodU family carbamoyl transferase